MNPIPQSDILDYSLRGFDSSGIQNSFPVFFSFPIPNHKISGFIFIQFLIQIRYLNSSAIRSFIIEEPILQNTRNITSDFPVALV